jgi:hypothetical protein
LYDDNPIAFSYAAGSLPYSPRKGETTMKARLTLFLALLPLCAGAALAQTPDPCDGESGAAYGLCNAYCEAMDCDSDNAQASATACTKVKDKFTNITGRTSLPCEGSVCPCNVPGTLFGDYVAGNITITSCQKGTSTRFTGIQLNAFAVAAYTDGITGTWTCIPPSTLISEEEGMRCIELLEQAAANQNVTCVVP